MSKVLMIGAGGVATVAAFKMKDEMRQNRRGYPQGWI